MCIALILWVTPVSPESPCDELSLPIPSFPLSWCSGQQWGWNGTEVGCVKSMEEWEGGERDGLGKVFCRGVWSCCFGRENRLDVQEGGCQALGAESRGMWGWPESSLWWGKHGTQKEEGTATRRQGKPKEGWQKAEEMGSSSSVSGGSRYTSGHSRTWAQKDLEKSPKVPNSRAPSQGICGDGEDLKMAPAC